GGDDGVQASQLLRAFAEGGQLVVRVRDHRALPSAAGGGHLAAFPPIVALSDDRPQARTRRTGHGSHLGERPSKARLSFIKREPISPKLSPGAPFTPGGRCATIAGSARLGGLASRRRRRTRDAHRDRTPDETRLPQPRPARSPPRTARARRARNWRRGAR